MEELIFNVQKYKILYDTNDVFYKNNSKKDRIWKKIGEELNEDWETLKKKWKNLRDNYIKHLKSLKTITGQKRKGNERYRTWPWAEYLSFLKPYMQFAESESNVSLQNAVYEDNSDSNKEQEQEQEQRFQQVNVVSENENSDLPSQPPSLKIKANSQLKRKYDKLQESSSSVDKVIKFLSDQGKEPAYDDIDLTCLAYARTIKTLSKKRQIMVKYRFSQILMEEELAEQNENTFVTGYNVESYPTSPDNNIANTSSYSLTISPINNNPLKPCDLSINTNNNTNALVIENNNSNATYASYTLLS